MGRIAAQTAKQVILQRIREAERQMMYEEYIDRVCEVVTGIVQQAGDRNNVLVDLGKVEALLPRSEQVDGERYEQGSRIKAVITEVRSGTKGPQVILSRRDPELIRTLFELEVPEIADGLVEIRGVAREPGYRSKIAVESHAQGVDPVGACVGPRGSRVRMVVSELRGEKIDIIPWNPEPARFVAKALSPARVREVYIDDETQGGDGHRPRRPARARDRQGGPERPSCRPPLRLEGRDQVRLASSRRTRPRPPSAAAATTESSSAAARRSSRTASAARTLRSRAAASAACRPTRSWPAKEARGEDISRPDRRRAAAEAEFDDAEGRARDEDELATSRPPRRTRTTPTCVEPRTSCGCVTELRSGAARAADAGRRSATSCASSPATALSSSLAGRGTGRLHVPPPRLLRACLGANGFNRVLATVSVDPELARLYTDHRHG